MSLLKGKHDNKTDKWNKNSWREFRALTSEIRKKNNFSLFSFSYWWHFSLLLRGNKCQLVLRNKEQFFSIFFEWWWKWWWKFNYSSFNKSFCLNSALSIETFGNFWGQKGLSFRLLRFIKVLWVIKIRRFRLSNDKQEFISPNLFLIVIWMTNASKSRHSEKSHN